MLLDTLSSTAEIEREPTSSMPRVPESASTSTDNPQVPTNQLDVVHWPIRVGRVVLSGTPYRISPPLVFSLTQSDGVYFMEGEFEICMAHESSDELTTTLLQETLELLWKEYALEDEDALDQKARELKASLLDRFEACVRA